MKSRYVNLLKHLFQRKRVYLDYAAATPVCDEVRRAMLPYMADVFANPGAIHHEGQMARTAVEDARTSLARTLRVRASEVTFTSGGTESNNLALIGVVEAIHATGRAYSDMEIISTQIEHPSILETLRFLESRGARVRFAPVDEDGRIVLDAFAALLTEKTVLVTIGYVNSEVGVIQNVRDVSRRIQEARSDAYLHVDASQAPLWLPCALDSLGADLMTLDSAKCYGPKGGGVLVHRERVPLRPYLHGGDQERGLRPGTENVSVIVGAVTAVVRAQRDYEIRAKRVRTLRDLFFTLLDETLGDASSGFTINGSRTHRVANNVNVSIDGVEGEFAVVSLDVRGIAASTRSACTGGKGGGSHVVATLSGDDERASSTVRFTLGEETSEGDIRHAVLALVQHVQGVRNVNLGTK